MRGRLTKLLVSILTSAMIMTSLPVNLLTVQAAKEQDFTVNVPAYATDEQINPVNDGESYVGEADMYSVSAGDFQEKECEVTRAQWLSMLASTFSMSIEGDSYPDNYFSDLDSSSEYYYDVLLNVEFGVIDVEAGGEVRPEEPATREFAAHTLNHCLGFQSDGSTASSYNDIEDSIYKEDICVAISRGWFEPVDGAVLPEQSITLEEATVMLADAEEVLLSTKEGTDDNEDVIALYDYTVNSDNETVTIIEYKGSEASVEIPSDLDGYTVTAIGNSVFENNTEINSVIIPDSVTSIGNKTFENCTQLESVKLSNSLTSMGQWAFKNCDSITAINIPKSLISGSSYTSSGYGAFAGCTGLKSVTFEEGITTVAKYLFDGCDGLEKIIIPDSVTTIDAGAFRGCCNLNEIVFSNRLTTIGNQAFESCTSLSDIVLPDSVTSMGNRAFQNCSILESVELSDSLTSMGYWAFRNCNAITTISIPKSLTSGSTNTSRKYGAFAGCTGLKSVIFEEGTTEVAKYLFDGCECLEEIIIPDGVSIIESGAFRECSNLKKVVIPETVTTIGNEAFDSCISLTSIEIPDSVTEMGDRTFQDCSKLESVKLSNNLTNMGYCAFKNCDAITTISIPKSLVSGSSNTGEKYGAFSNCTGLKSVLFEEGTTEIAEYLFDGCDGLEEITIPDSVRTIKTGAFRYCTNLKKVVFSSNLTTIEKEAFKACSSLTNIEIPDSVTSIESGVFGNCTKLITVKLPKDLSVLAGGLFNGCSSLTTVNIPDFVTSIEKEVFKNCDSLVSMEIPGMVTTIGNYVFSDCDKLQSVTIPDSVKIMGTYVFQSCDELTEVNLGLGLTNIPIYTFAYCGKLAEIVIPYNVTTINGNAFKNCTLLTEITIPQKTTTIHTDAFSYPTQMTVYGVSGSYAETYASEKGMTFVERVVPATTVTLPQSSYTVNRNSTVTLIPTITPLDFTDLITYKSADTSVATVDTNGKVKGIAVGTTTIKVTVGNVSTSCTITVTQPVTSISLSKSAINMNALDTYDLTATVNPSNASNHNIQWSSSDENIATVSESGMVTAVSKGTCNITATAMDGSGVFASCTVTVANNVYIADSIEDLQSVHPYENNCTDIWQYSIAGAAQLEVTFDAETYMEDGFDYLYILDGENNEIGRYTGNELSNETIKVAGDTVRIKLSTDSGSNEYGFKVTAITPIKQTISYTIVYNKNAENASGTMPEQQVEYNSGTKLTANAFVNNGYIFAGWNTEADGSGESFANLADASLFTVEDGTTLTLYACWTPEEYTITYNLDGGTNAEENPTVYNVETATITLKNPTRSGYTFAGWYSDMSFETQVTKIEEGSLGDITLYASWTAEEYTITYNLDGGTNAEENPTVYNVETATVTLKNPTRSGYTFAGWYSDMSFETQVTKIEKGSLGDITLYAKWSVNKYKITYKLNGGKNNSGNPSTYYVTTSTITLKKPTKTGYTFGGWYSDSKFKNKVTKIKKGSTGNKTLYAKWTVNKYTVKFDGNGATGGKMSSLKDRKYGTGFKLTSNVYKRTGYTFKGWNTKANGKGTTYKNNANVKNLTSANGKTVTLYAQWSPNKYKITYKLNGGKNNNGNPSSYNVTTTIKLKTPTRSGYTFKGWYSDSKFKNKVTRIKKGSTGNKTLYAKWVKK